MECKRIRRRNDIVVVDETAGVEVAAGDGGAVPDLIPHKPYFPQRTDCFRFRSNDCVERE